MALNWFRSSLFVSKLSARSLIVTLAQNDYNELGELMLKKLHSASETSYAQEIDYLYDVRGWLNNINNLADASQRKLYAQQLNYFGNGNIQNMSWKNTLLVPVCNWHLLAGDL